MFLLENKFKQHRCSEKFTVLFCSANACNIYINGWFNCDTIPAFPWFMAHEVGLIQAQYLRRTNGDSHFLPPYVNLPVSFQWLARWY